MTIRRFRSDRRGNTAVEFALVVPLFSLITLVMIQAGLFFWASAGLQHSIGEGARLASVWPRKSDAEIIARIRETAFGTAAADLQAPVLVSGKIGKVFYVDITVRYTARLALFGVPTINMTEQRRVYRPS